MQHMLPKLFGFVLFQRKSLPVHENLAFPRQKTSRQHAYLFCALGGDDLMVFNESEYMYARLQLNAVQWFKQRVSLLVQRTL